MHSNRLANEKSPYLLQHAHNPVDWYAWGPEAFEKARAENKPIFLSIGYSTCHWCHVMERESFENAAIAEVLNREYVAIKVDREERPDVDRIYMTFVQATTGGGGWPMSVWLTPALQPFFGGTYFPPENRWGHPGFGSVLTQVANAWRNDPEKVTESAADVVEQLKKHVAVAPAHAGGVAFDQATLDSGFNVFRRTFDTRLGGFGGAPKFPRPSVFNFLLRYYARTRNQEALDMVLLTLREMAKGGMHDQLGGGFHRYAVDERWFVPHFEKMLYDQAQLAISYLEAFQITGDGQYAATAGRIFDYVLRDMTDAEGGFYSAEDADSATSPEHPELKGEGAFYIWSRQEIQIALGEGALGEGALSEGAVGGAGEEALGQEAPGEALGQDAAAWFCYRYGVEADGNVEHDPHGEFTGKNILYQAHTEEETAARFDRPLEAVSAALRQAEAALLQARTKHVRPHLDDKVLTSWNGLMISALAMGGAILREPRYAEAARRAAEFIIARLYNSETGVLLRRYRQGDAAIPGFLDDYALFVQGLLDLYEAQFDLRHLQLARRLTEKQRELFEDTENGAFFSSAAGDTSLVLRVKEDYDGAEPSGNSVAAMNLLRLAQMTNHAAFRESAERTFAAFAPRLSHVPMAVPQMLAACEWVKGQPGEIILAGDKDGADTLELLRMLRSRFVPGKVVLLVDSAETRAALAAWIPSIASMTKRQGPEDRADERAAAYVCRNYTCQLPVFEADELAKLIQ